MAWGFFAEDAPERDEALGQPAGSAIPVNHEPGFRLPVGQNEQAGNGERCVAAGIRDRPGIARRYLY